MTLIELLISMSLFIILTAGFVTVGQGSERMVTLQTLRETMNRLVPLISSGCPMPADSGSPPQLSMTLRIARGRREQ